MLAVSHLNMPNILFFLFVAVLICLQITWAQYINSYQNWYYAYRPPVVILPSASAFVPTVIQQPIPFVPTVIQQPSPFVPTVIQQPSPKVVIDVHYETNCPDSMRFITNQLYPAYQEMEDIMEINLVPYGKAKKSFNPISQKYDFRCHHGPAECYGNTVQGCVFSMYPDIKDKMAYVNCMENYPRPSESAQKCARRQSLDWDRIDKCAMGDEGNRLLFEHALTTEALTPKMNFVPWIVINKVFSDKNQKLSQRDLKKVICDSYQGPPHLSCPSP